MGLLGRITPEVVDALSSLGTVQVIDLSDNRLFGSLPDVYGTNSSLRVLDLSHNQLTGTLPATWRVMGSLEVLDLSQNAWQVSLIFTRVQGPALL
jgi:Leucine-rich repeat (LRR) protein